MEAGFRFLIELQRLGQIAAAPQPGVLLRLNQTLNKLLKRTYAYISRLQAEVRTPASEAGPNALPARLLQRRDPLADLPKIDRSATHRTGVEVIIGEGRQPTRSGIARAAEFQHFATFAVQLV